MMQLLRLIRSILVMWLGFRFLETEVDGSNPGSISMLCPWARLFIRIVSVDLAVKWVPGGDTLMKGVLCYELLGGNSIYKSRSKTGVINRVSRKYNFEKQNFVIKQQ